MRILFVGDPHVTVDELSDSRQMIYRVIQAAKQIEKLDLICLLGDQHHNHSLLRVEVVHFWRDALASLDLAVPHNRWNPKVAMLVGNHDRPHDHAYEGHGLLYKDQCLVVDRATAIDSVLFVPWMPNDKFIEAVRSPVSTAGIRPRTLVCHQTFNGAKYENGFYAPDGVDTSVVSHFEKVISGHIHKPQSFANIEYVGAPRWRTMSDANQSRHLMFYDTETGAVEYFPMEGFCKAIYVHDDIEGVDAPAPKFLEPHTLYVNIRGSQAYVDSRKGLWEANVATFPTRTTKNEVRESIGVRAALMKHLEAFTPPNGTDLALLQNMVAERIHV